MADHLAFLLGDQRDDRVAVALETIDERRLGGSWKGEQVHGADRRGVTRLCRADGPAAALAEPALAEAAHVVAMSGASSAFMPTTL